MAKRNFNGSQINQSVTIAEQAGAEIADVRNLILKYDCLLYTSDAADEI